MRTQLCRLPKTAKAQLRLPGYMTGMAIERDFRKLAPATQAELRRIAVAMVRAGKTRIEAAATVG